MEGGVLGVLPGIIGTLQATEAIKLLTGIGEPMIGKLLHYDALNSRFKTFNTRKDPECKICGINPTIKGISKIKGYDEDRDFNEISVNELAHLIKNKKCANLVDVSLVSEELKEAVQTGVSIILVVMGAILACCWCLTWCGATVSGTLQMLEERYEGPNRGQ